MLILRCLSGYGIPNLKSLQFNSTLAMIMFLGLYLVSIISFVLLSFARGMYLDILNDYETLLTENKSLHIPLEESRNQSDS